MVKGMTRQVVVVKSPDQKLFDQAIFLVRPDAQTEGVSEAELLRQAREAAGIHISEEAPSGRQRRLSAVFGALAGGGLVGLAWVATVLL
ncbi:MAG: hypothetical protein MJ118_08785 [Clostridia bacterium]|nr:hypothetical protein [Clostridia bacterium]